MHYCMTYQAEAFANEVNQCAFVMSLIMRKALGRTSAVLDL